MGEILWFHVSKSEHWGLLQSSNSLGESYLFNLKLTLMRWIIYLVIQPITGGHVAAHVSR